MMTNHYSIALEQVTKIYGQGDTAVTAVNQVRLSLQAGDICLILGPSGSGKTTLLSLIGCLLKPTSGKISILGQEVSAMNERDLSAVRLQHLGFVFQNFNLLEALTTTENVEIAVNLRHRDGKQRAKELLHMLGMSHRASYLPEKLSGGEKQRVAIARALANDPKIILADEPTANLDCKTGHEVIGLLCRIAQSKRKTAIIVSHDLRIRDVATKVLHLEDGRLRED